MIGGMQNLKKGCGNYFNNSGYHNNIQGSQE